MTAAPRFRSPLMTLKIDVDTDRGTREGVPALVRVLRAHRARATFLFSLGPDHTGWALRRALRPGFFSKVARTSVVAHYGFRTLMHGLLLPGPDIGRRCAGAMRQARDAGFECGIHTWDHVLWQDNVGRRDAAWTLRLMRLAAARFAAVFGAPAPTHGAAGWQMNRYAFEEHERARYRYASDSRAMLNENGTLRHKDSGPHRIALDNTVLSCVQLPTTLPTLDELLGREVGGRLIHAGNVAPHLLGLTEGARRDHVYTLHAELEGHRLAPVFEQLLAGWRLQGYTFAALADYHERVKDRPLPVSAIGWARLPGRSGQLLVQREPCMHWRPML
jgi:undecaprenyl phosphate-alpha-L-ara4FN deformylase